MTTNPTIRELIDACRPDQQDPQRAELAADLAPLARELEQPEVAEVLKRSERFDRNVRSALDDVPVPAGLAERLLAKCDAAMVSSAGVPEVIAAAGKKPSRRRFLAQLSIAASLLIVALAAYPAYTFIFQKPRPVTAEELAQTTVTWFDDCGPGASWSKVDSAILTQYPLDPALRYRPLVYRRVNSNTVAYNLSANGKRALLFVHLPSRPHPTLHKFPYGPLPATGGISLGAWERSSVVYVIGVTGSDQRWPVDQFVKKQKTT